MDFGQWLVHKRWLKRSEYRALKADEFQRLFSKYRGDRKDGFQWRSIDDLGDDFESIREIPFGKVLEAKREILDQVLQRSKKASVNELAKDWYAWHRDHLEPICEYCLRHHMGEQLYEQQEAKKSVARFLIDGKVDPAGSIIQEHNVVVLFEGTSALYAGLAIAASDRKATVITSNSGLIREFRDNPAVQEGFHEVFIVGGKADTHWCEVDGEVPQEQYVSAVSSYARETIVVVPLSCVTPTLGPSAKGPACPIRGAIVREIFESEHLRYVVFIADYKKLGDTNAEGARPIFARGEWPDLVRRHKQRMLIVTSPSPQLRAAYDIARVYGVLDQLDVARRDMAQMEQQEPFASLGFTFTEEDRAYDEVAKSVCEMGLRLFEAWDPGGICTKRVVFELTSLQEKVAVDPFKGLLSRDLGTNIVGQLNIYMSQDQYNVEFDVRGPAEALDNVHQIRLTEDVLRNVFGPECVLRSVRVEGIKGANYWEVSSSTTPVNRMDIVRAALRT